MRAISSLSQRVSPYDQLSLRALPGLRLVVCVHFSALGSLCINCIYLESIVPLINKKEPRAPDNYLKINMESKEPETIKDK